MISVVIPALNEGPLLRQTIAAARDDLRHCAYEIVVVDDASTDGCAAEPLACDTLITNAARLGVSPAKAAGADAARGDVLIFLDGHCRPTPGALPGLADLARRSYAVVAPRLAGLDESTFEVVLGRPAVGLHYQPITLECRYIYEDHHAVRPAGPGAYEVPSVSGACTAVRADVYRRIGGYDESFGQYGVEDYDFALGAFTLGYEVVCAAELVVGHRFRASFHNYGLDMAVVRANHLRLAYKHICRGDDPATVDHWAAWVAAARRRWGGDYDRAYHLFESTLKASEARRRALEAAQRRTGRGIAQHAERFGADWPPAPCTEA